MQANETKVNKARLNPGQQWIGLNNLILDERFQPRDETNLKWANVLSDAIRGGSVMPAIDVIQLLDGRLIVAAGFHRYTAARLAGETDILCNIRDGTEEDAIVLAAGSNRDADGKRKMSDLDITKAVEMLLAIEGWWRKSDKQIADHVGCSGPKVRAVRNRFAICNGRELPKIIEISDGRRVVYRRSRNPREVIIRKRTRRDGRSDYFEGHLKGKSIRGSTEDEVEAKLAKIKESASLKLSELAMRQFAARLGFLGVFPRSQHYQGVGRTHYLGGTICVACDLTGPESLPVAVGRLIAARRYRGDLSARMVVLCYPEDGPAKVIDLYRQEGFEFLTPEELAESLKAE